MKSNARRVTMRVAAMLCLLMWTVGCASSAPADDGEPVDPLFVAGGEADSRVSADGDVAIKWLAEGNNAYVGELTIKPGTEVPLHNHDSEEYLVFQQGGGVLTIDGRDHQVSEGMAVLIPEGAEHSFVNGDEMTIALQVFSSPQGAQRYLDWEQGEITITEPVRERRRGGERERRRESGQDGDVERRREGTQERRRDRGDDGDGERRRRR